MWGHYAAKQTGIDLRFVIPDQLLVQLIYRKRLFKMEVDSKDRKRKGL